MPKVSNVKLIKSNPYPEKCDANKQDANVDTNTPLLISRYLLSTLEFGIQHPLTILYEIVISVNPAKI